MNSPDRRGKTQIGESYQGNEVNKTYFAEKAPNFPFMEYDSYVLCRETFEQLELAGK